MKRKILALGLLSMCCVALFTSDSQAFGLLAPYRPHSLWNKHNRYTTTITCRPYNAFTPICWGNLVCDGCNPSPCGVASGCLPLTMGMPPWACQGGQFGGMPYMGGASASDMPPMMSPAPSPYMPPMPMPVGPNTTMNPYSGVAQANYPMYAPQYQPNYYMPTYYQPYMGWQQQQPMPNYWYGYGR